MYMPEPYSRHIRGSSGKHPRLSVFRVKRDIRRASYVRNIREESNLVDCYFCWDNYLPYNRLCINGNRIRSSRIAVLEVWYGEVC